MIKKQVIYISGDHAGFKIKQKIIPWLEKQGHKVIDCGPFKYKKDDDYPDFVIPMAKKVAKNKDSRGVIIAGSGQGEVVAANRIRGIRTVLYYGYVSPQRVLKLSRAHNDSNVISMGAKVLSVKQIKQAIKIWLAAPFSNSTRHKRRLKKLDK